MFLKYDCNCFGKNRHFSGTMSVKLFFLPCHNLMIPLLHPEWFSRQTMIVTLITFDTQ